MVVISSAHLINDQYPVTLQADSSFLWPMLMVVCQPLGLTHRSICWVKADVILLIQSKPNGLYGDAFATLLAQKSAQDASWDEASSTCHDTKEVW